MTTHPLLLRGPSIHQDTLWFVLITTSLGASLTCFFRDLCSTTTWGRQERQWIRQAIIRVPFVHSQFTAVVAMLRRTPVLTASKLRLIPFLLHKAKMFRHVTTGINWSCTVRSAPKCEATALFPARVLSWSLFGFPARFPIVSVWGSVANDRWDVRGSAQWSDKRYALLSLKHVGRIQDRVCTHCPMSLITECVYCRAAEYKVWRPPGAL